LIIDVIILVLVANVVNSFTIRFQLMK